MVDSRNDSARVLHIVAKRKRHPLATASADDFKLRDAGPVDAIERVLTNPGVTPYCFDLERRALLLVETAAHVNLMRAPFLYDAQYAHAQCAYTLPLGALKRLTTPLPDPENVLLLYSTGRCGSTLMVNAMAELGYAATWSEPDIFTQFAMAGPPMDPATRTVLIEAMRGCMRLLRRPGHATHVLKLRSIAIEHWEMLAEAVPGASRVFLYRNAVDFARSTARIMGLPLDHPGAQVPITQAWRLLAPRLPRGCAEPEQLAPHVLLSHLWAGSVLGYLDTHASGCWLGAARYEDICRNPEAILARLLRCLHLPPQDAQRALPAFQRDSQAGTVLARPATHPAPQAAQQNSRYLEEAIASCLHGIRPDLSPGLRLPGTWSADAAGQCAGPAETSA